MEFKREEYTSSNGKTYYTRSGWELNFMFYLEWMKGRGEIKDWEYEPERIVWMGGSYLPDFKVWRNDGTYYFCEVKGKPQGIRKFKRAQKERKGIKFELWGKDEYNELKRKLGKVCGFI